jgi:DNA topoisomerase-2
MYKKRKAWQLKQIEAEVYWLSEKSRFIRDVAVTPKLHVFNTPLVQIHDQLRREKYAESLWPKLLDIKTYQYTKEEVAKLEALCAAKRQEHAQLKATSVVQLWKNNLSEI